MQATHDEVFKQKKLPNVGQTFRSKKYGTLWRVMEKREIWQSAFYACHFKQYGLNPFYYKWGEAYERLSDCGGQSCPSTFFHP